MALSDLPKHLIGYLLPGTFLLISILCSSAAAVHTCSTQANHSTQGHVQTALMHPILVLTALPSFREKAFASLWAIGGIVCAFDTPASLTPLLVASRGVILDVGPGSGHQVFRFSNIDGIDAIYGVEPGESMHAALKQRAARAGLGAKYHVLGCEAKLESMLPALVKAGALKYDDGVEAREMMVFDEVVCIRVLCGVPDLDAVVAGLYSLLKPGGRMVVCEHVVNSGDVRQRGSVIGRLLQQIYMLMAWKSLMGGCELTRDTLASLHRAAERDGGWAKVQVKVYDPYSTIPHIVGELVKKKK